MKRPVPGRRPLARLDAAPARHQMQRGRYAQFVIEIDESEHALDRMAGLLREAGVKDALISAGGSSVLAVGWRGGGWAIDIKSRQVRRERLARVRIRNAALATSGAGEQFVEVDGVRYGHVIDPRTGWPARGVLSVSVVADEAAVADALSTAFLVGGPALARQYCAAHSETLVLVTPDDGTESPLMFGSHRGVMIEDETAALKGVALQRGEYA